MIAASLGAGLLPVLLFLGGLRLLDSFKLVRVREVATSIGAGAAAALIAWALNAALLDVARVDPGVLRRFVAPALEEILKAAWVLALVRRHRVGFMVDAALHGFAVGTGFALVENAYYALALESFEPGVWMVRGLGTAVLHGSTTAVVGILAMNLSDGRESSSLHHFLPGIALAIFVHALFNNLLLSPFVMTAILLVAMPLFVVAVFERSEHGTRDWLGRGFDGDVERLEQILEGTVEHTPVGEYLDSLRHHFQGAVLADMLCIVRMQLELSLRAKGLLIARAAGVELPPDPEVRARLDEIRYLERAIGPTGLLALQPLLRTSRRDLWQAHVLGRSA